MPAIHVLTVGPLPLKSSLLSFRVNLPIVSLDGIVESEVLSQVRANLWLLPLIILLELHSSQTNTWQEMKNTLLSTKIMYNELNISKFNTKNLKIFRVKYFYKINVNEVQSHSL